MATKISNCGHDEHGTYHGGSAGDQSGTEYYVRDWYQFATAVYRHPTTKIANMIATVAKAAAENDCIGYDQDDRTTFYTQLKAVDWYPEKITKKCEADCSSSTAACVIAAGHRCNDEKCQKVAYTMTTYNEDSQLKSAGFSKLTDSKYLTSGDYLKKGDILWKDGHTAVVVSNGSKVSSSSSSSSSSSGSSSSSSSKLPTFAKGTYTITASSLNVRKTASLSGTKLKKSQLTSDGQKHANSDGSLKKNTAVDVSSTKNETSTKTVWGKIPSGYICLYQDGSTYVKKKSSSSSSSSTSSSKSSSSYSTGNYVITASSLNVRTGAGTNYSKKAKTQLTADGQKHANADGSLKKGTTVTVSQVKKNGSDTWGKIPSGWICLQQGSSKYVKKA